ncbi:MAG: ferritin [Actinobacteria bacterium]|nr:ferritin [Actinomycetota bacterium]
MIDERMRTEINKQINAELYSAYLYLSMATYFEDQGLPGFANWMYCQNQEETFHGMKFLHYLVERGGRVDLLAIDEPPREWASPLAVLEHVYEHEQHVTSLINNLVDIAEEIKDRATFNELQWFVEEQVEEEASAETLVTKLRMIKDTPGPLLMIDNELATRVFTPPDASE